MNTHIKLSEDEGVLALKTAWKRYDAARKAGVQDGKIGRQSVVQTDFAGFCGEMAFCKLMGVKPDFTVGPRSGTYDCIVDGHRVDVKTTHYLTGRLLVKGYNEDVDIYVLMVGNLFDGFYYKGWLPTDEIVCADNHCEHGPFSGSYLAEQNELYLAPIGSNARE